jgi:hypothetical protein
VNKYFKPEVIVSVVSAGLILGALVVYGRKIPVIGENVAQLAAMAK